MTPDQIICDTVFLTKDYVHQQLLFSGYTAIKQWLYNCLVTCLSVYTSTERIICINDEKVSLFKGRDNKRILYISGIALRLSKSQNFSSMEIASQLAACLSANYGDAFRVQIVPPGWIHLELTHLTVATWLQSLVDGGVSLGGGETPRENRDKLFAVQYAYARCCSLVRLAEREGLIKLSPAGLFQHPLLWLNNEHQLYFNHLAEFRLMSELVQVVDDWVGVGGSSSVNWEKAALNLSQAFEAFWVNCRIWGEVKIAAPELAQARLGLLLATQFVLRSLLAVKLGIIASGEL
jgi:arginyl-tRNA synthetase